MRVEKCMNCSGTNAEPHVLWDCMPVPAFGNIRSPKLQVATLSLNPSKLEFYDRGGQPRPRSERLPMVADFVPAGTRADLSEETIEQADAVRLQYFSNKPHSWFTPMQMILRAMNLSWSYAEGTAVNLDIVACATNPSFGDLAANVRMQMAQNCRSFLVETLSAFPDGIWIVVNGKGAFDGLKEAVEMVPNDAYTQKLPNQQIQVFVGELQVNRKRFPYFAWNIYLHYSRMNQAGALVDFWHKLPRLL